MSFYYGKTAKQAANELHYRLNSETSRDLKDVLVCVSAWLIAGNLLSGDDKKDFLDELGLVHQPTPQGGWIVTTKPNPEGWDHV